MAAGREGGKLYCRRLLWQHGGREGSFIVEGYFGSRKGGREGGREAVTLAAGREGSFIAEGYFGSREGCSIG